jgi:hypothetical protein
VQPSRTAVFCACALVAATLAACGTASARQPVVDRQPVVQATTPAPPPTTTPTTAPEPVSPPTTTPPSIPAVAGWTAPIATLPPGGGITSVSCLSDTYCIAAGGGANQADVAQTTGAGLTQSWDGATWSAPSTYDPAPTTPTGIWPVMPAITCTSGPFCVIVDGAGNVSNGDGTNWMAPAPLPTAAALPANPADPGPGHIGSRTAAVSCPSPTVCAIVTNTGTADVWRHGAWLTPQAFGTPGPAGSATALYSQGRVGVSCATTTSCVAVVGTSLLDWDGTTWTQAPSPWVLGTDPHGAAVSCSTPTLCASVSGPDLSYRNGGGWSTPAAIDPGGVLDAVSCPTPSYCVAADTTGSVVTFDGSSWSAPVRVLPAPSEYAPLGTSVDCTPTHFCMVISADGEYTTSDPSAVTPAVTPTTTAPAGTAPAAG